jgi:hypothetical protein
VFVKKIKPFSNFASPSEKLVLFKNMASASMMEFWPFHRRPRALGGMFGAWKILGESMRLLADVRPANFLLIDMSGVRKWLQAYSLDNPDCEVARRALDLLSPSSLAQMPAGVRVKASSDLKNFYHYLGLEGLEWLKELFGFECVRARDVGLDPNVVGEWVWPVLTTLPMGFLFAPLVAQLIHERVARPVLHRPLSLLRDRHWTRSRLVPLSDAPPSWIQSVIGALDARGLHRPGGPPCLPPSLSDIKVPASIFALCPAEGRRSVPADVTLARVRVVPWDLRAVDLERAVDTYPALEGVSVVHLFWLLYIDDHNNFARTDASAPIALAEVTSNYFMVLMLFAYAFAGFAPHQKKLAWATAAPSPTIGIVVDLTLPARTRFYVDSAKLAELREFTILVVRCARRARELGIVWAVPVRFLQHVVHSWVWAMLPRRSVLCVFHSVFSQVCNKSPTAKLVLAPSTVWELETAAFLTPLLYAETRPISNVVGASDACSTGRGAAVRGACPPVVLAELCSKAERHGSWTAFSPLVPDGGLAGRSKHVQCRDTTAGRRAARWVKCDRDLWLSGKATWKQVRAGPWTTCIPRTINLGELLGAVELAAWFASQPRRFGGHRIPCLGDNQAALGALAKGRSSVWDMNTFGCRRVCAYSLAADMEFLWIYLLTDLMPADFPSRRHLLVQAKSAWVDAVAAKRKHHRGDPRPSKTFDSTLGFPGEGPPRLRSGPSVWKGAPLNRPKVRPEPVNVTGLRFRTVNGNTAHAYLRTFPPFLHWLEVFGYGTDTRSVGAWLESYVFWAFESGEVSKQQVTNLLACVAKLDPGLNKSGELAPARSCLDGWAKMRPPVPRPHIPAKMLRLFVARCLATGRLGLSVILLLGFECYLRFSELMFLRRRDIALPGDPRVDLPPGHAGVFLRWTKAGRPQFVTVEDPLVVLALQAWCVGADWADRMFPYSAYGIRKDFADLQRELGLFDVPFVFHGLRSGGATRDWRLKRRTFPAVQIRGRWADTKTARDYLRDVEARTKPYRFPPEVTRLAGFFAAREALFFDAYRAFL